MVAVSVGAWALRLAAIAAALAVVGVRRRSLGVVALLSAMVLVVAAVLALAEAFWSNDFSLAYVADHAHRDAGLGTRLSGMWGGMGGSLLCFALGTVLFAGVAVAHAPVAHRGVVAAVGGGVTAGLVGVVAVLSNPFRRLEIPAVDGSGLTPILEHPAMLYHPPLVYAGLTSLTAAFALTIAALHHRQLDHRWLALVRRWLLVPWTLLAIGMLAGAHWAYVELGWGGYWAWDPVENTALLPWLAVTAALHALHLPTARRRVVVLVGAAFLLALFGGLLTRSGATMSVHAFAEDASIGRAFAVLLGGATLGFVALVVSHWRGDDSPGAVADRRWWPPTRSRALRLQQGLVVAALLTVLLGSVWPLAAELRGGRGLTVDGTFFTAVCGPVAVVLLLAVAVGPSLGRVPHGTAALVPAIGAAIGLGLAALDGWTGLFGLATAAAGGAAIAGTGLGVLRGGATASRVGSSVAHLGVTVLLLGVAGTTTGATETVVLADGQSTVVQGHRITNRGAAVVDRPAAGTEAVEATVIVAGHRFNPQLVVHSSRNRVLAESALHSTLSEDVQVMLRDVRDDASVVLQVGVHPLMQLVWWGGLLLVTGGAVAYGATPLSRPGRVARHRPGDDAASRATIPASPLAAEAAPEPPDVRGVTVPPAQV